MELKLDVIDHTFKALAMNLKWIVFFSIPFLLAFVVQMLSPLPTYTALGGAFLRTGSIPNMSGFDLAIVIIAVVFSIFSISVALVSINITVKHNRTLTRIPKEVVEAVEKNVLELFWLLLGASILYFVVYLLAYEYSVQEIVGPLVTLVVSLGLFYAPAAIVIDNMRLLRAVQASYRHIYRNPAVFLIWIAVALLALVALDAAFITVKGSVPFARYLLLIINALIILPFLIVLQTQSYLTKYSILK